MRVRIDPNENGHFVANLPKGDMNIEITPEGEFIIDNATFDLELYTLKLTIKDLEFLIQAGEQIIELKKAFERFPEFIDKDTVRTFYQAKGPDYGVGLKGYIGKPPLVKPPILKNGDVVYYKDYHDKGLRIVSDERLINDKPVIVNSNGVEVGFCYHYDENLKHNESPCLDIIAVGDEEELHWQEGLREGESIY